MSPAADPKSAWAQVTEDQRFLNSCGLGAFATVLIVYSIAGVVFGYLPFFLGSEFAMLQGVPALLTAAGCFALGAAWGSHVMQRHWSTASAQGCEAFRGTCYMVWGVCWVGAVLTVFLATIGNVSLHRPLAIDPNAEWLLAPLPWAWKHGVQFASDRFAMRLFIVGFLALMVALLLLKIWPRLTFLSMGVIAFAVGAYFIGDASYLYAAARGLSSIVSPELAMQFKANPGLHNAWTFVCLWLGAAALFFGTLLTAGGLFLPRKAFDHMR